MNPNAVQDPLAQLRDIHLPAPVSWWPLAPGWYMLIALVLIVLGFLLWHSYKRRQQRLFQQTVLAELDSYLQQPSPAWEKINLLIKRVAFIHHPRQHIAGLTGEAWLAWLDKKTGHPQEAPRQSVDIDSAMTNPFTHGPGRILLTGPYQKSTPAPEDIHRLLHHTLIQLLTHKGDAC